jgi:alkylation response protein AidB-like acyl-CoA dehydrogenase
VAHPLAEASTEVASAWDSVVVAAWRLELEGDVDAARLAAAAAARAGLVAAYASHQVHGAVGFTRELGLDRFSAGIRQMSLHPPVPTVGVIGVVA